MKRNTEILLYGIGGAVAVAGAIFIVRDVNKKLKAVRYAKSFLGQEEKTGNLGFKSPEFEAMMRDVGWQKGQAWCNYFAKVIWVNKFKKDADLISKLMSGSTQGTYKAFKNDTSGKFEVGQKAHAGDVVIWQKYSNGKATDSGHAGIVTKAGKDSFDTIEGNTNDKGGREGYIVSEKTRKYNFGDKSGLVLKGFIHYKG